MSSRELIYAGYRHRFGFQLSKKSLDVSRKNSWKNRWKKNQKHFLKFFCLAFFWTTQLCGPATCFSVRWRFIYGKFWKIYVNGTLRRDITKPPFLSLRASFTETFSAPAEKWKQNLARDSRRENARKNSSNRSKFFAFCWICEWMHQQ